MEDNYGLKKVKAINRDTSSELETIEPVNPKKDTWIDKLRTKAAAAEERYIEPAKQKYEQYRREKKQKSEEEYLRKMRTADKDIEMLERKEKLKEKKARLKQLQKKNPTKFARVKDAIIVGAKKTQGGIKSAVTTTKTRKKSNNKGMFDGSGFGSLGVNNSFGERKQQSGIGSLLFQRGTKSAGKKSKRYSSGISKLLGNSGKKKSKTKRSKIISMLMDD
jgi:exonuclease VII large subunit